METGATYNLCTILGLADDEETGRSHGVNLSSLRLQKAWECAPGQHVVHVFH